MPQIWEGRKYSLSESTNFDSYMKELGVGFFARRVGNITSPTIELKKEGDEYSMITNTLFGEEVKRFKSGQPFDEVAFDGSPIKSVITVDGNKFVHNVGSNPPQTVINDFGEKEMVATMKVHDVTSTRKYVAKE